MNRPEVIAERVARGFDLFERIKPGWYRDLDPKTCTIYSIELTFGLGSMPASTVGLERIDQAITSEIGRPPRPLDRWMFGLSAEPAWVKEEYLTDEWRRQVERAQHTGSTPLPQRSEEELVECARCGAPRWDNETVRRDGDQIVCDPRCP
jgi:hypothetical protein